MTNKRLWLFTSVLLVLAMVLSACGGAATTQAPAPTQAPVATQAPAPTQAPATTEAPAATQAPATTEAPATTAPTTAPTVAATVAPLTIGMILVGPKNDGGWSQSTYDGVNYAISKMNNGSKLLLIENAFSEKSTPAQIAEQLVSQGAQVVIFNSDSFMDDSNTFAQANPKIPTIMLSGDQEWAQGQDYKNFPNMIDIMGRMEYMKEIAGCAAALTTQTGKIGFLGPLINPETRRLASSAYLGAKYCWTQVLKKDPSALTFSVTWIGYWYNEPGTTLDPTQVADNFYNTGFDVVISGIDTTEALVEAQKMTNAGKKVFAIPYDYINACSGAPNVCLGVPYFNWGPALLQNLEAISNGTWKPHFEWNPPDWANFDNPDYGAVGFNIGAGLSADNKATLEKFISDLAGGLNLWTGPINLQDGTVYLKAGEVATDQQIWYLPQLLEGMLGKSS
jgi:simple sugar transport system substrate-binding protein